MAIRLLRQETFRILSTSWFPLWLSFEDRCELAAPWTPQEMPARRTDRCKKSSQLLIHSAWWNLHVRCNRNQMAICLSIVGAQICEGPGFRVQATTADPCQDFRKGLKFLDLRAEWWFFWFLALQNCLFGGCKENLPETAAIWPDVVTLRTGWQRDSWSQISGLLEGFWKSMLDHNFAPLMVRNWFI